MTFDEWISDKEFTQYVENGERYILQKLCFEAGQENADYELHKEIERYKSILRRVRVELMQKRCANIFGMDVPEWFDYMNALITGGMTGEKNM